MESSISAGNLASAREEVVGELVRGQEFAAQLKLVLHHQLTGTPDASATTEAEDLVARISRSFSEALSLLNYTHSGKVSPTAPPPPSSRNQHGKPSKRRKLEETWTRITSEPIADGYSWRKYGQKHILNAKHLRCYYRCTNRFDQGCQATKQVQRTEDETPMFWTKYVGHHTCQDILKLSMDMDSADEEGFLINFQSNITTKQDPLFTSTFPSGEAENEKSCHSKEEQECIPSSGDSSSSSGTFDMDFDLIDFVYLNDVFYDDELFSH